ncbi:hypothetical protein BJ741DRAFT_580900 [Chytriomyces cf. hyalinus JEL632]|nr:hypothetical protein BJ741DRAFT_580900 [Chytriomyces cf. hyalinus JEL632]
MDAIVRDIQKEVAERLINLDTAADEGQAELVECYSTQGERDLRQHLEEMALGTKRETYFFRQPSPTSSMKKEPARASSPSVCAKRHGTRPDTDGQQQLDLPLPAESGIF